MEEKLIKEAYKLRYEYYNFYEGSEHKWHIRYENHDLYEAVLKSFDYDFKEIAAVMPKLIEKYAIVS